MLCIGELYLLRCCPINVFNVDTMCFYCTESEICFKMKSRNRLSTVEESEEPRVTLQNTPTGLEKPAVKSGQYW